MKLESKKKSKLSFTVDLKAMICDTPQRAECKAIKGHGGFHACERCEVKGARVNGVTCFADLDQKARSDATWDEFSVNENIVSINY